jgi:wyosine [tRNA(Phe)-imidazoG37] synthetase (radical SAM superfamily)
MLLPLQAGILYGPIRSRRLGRSLGVNLFPSSQKVCSFDCIYCHYGRTGAKTLFPAEDGLSRVDEVLQAMDEALLAHHEIDYITFSGNGEPTLHPRFPEIVAGVCRLRDELRPGVKLAILSNSTGLLLPHVRETLGHFDAPIMKLDGGDPETWARINRPVPEVELEQVLQGLEGIPGLIIQSVLLDGPVSNVGGQAFQAWLSALSRVSPIQVQIYSTDRPVPEAGVERVPPATLRLLASKVRGRTGLEVRAYWPGK